MPQSKGYRSKSRNVFKKDIRERGLSPLGRLLVNYSLGDKVVIDIDPSIVKGMPHRRFQGKVGVIIEKRGKCYVVKVEEGKKTKLVIARPEHLRAFK